MNVSELAVGQEIPTFVRKTDFANWNRYAAVNHEFVPIHMDDDAGKEAGYPGAFGMGRLQASFLVNVLTQWLGESGRIKKLDMQFRAPNLKNLVVTAGGKITAIRKEKDGTYVDLEVWSKADNNTVLAPGTATVVID